ncbi:hypothetical protein M011DRAFT_484897 [Sporormia fimetaria CBS 119925]|uniref:Uncharacterized protein n=1 Tax=Sporormia fimetaria CBS 119925 TaxID=1340428 RepID=A0A6A6VFZ1_9PLEO|nr:hypothetical protein M011DRAFT_484897 [Sporormia fimetaria CBS 119925]
MPPKGLYTWPRHHELPGGVPRPVFDAQDFANDDEEVMAGSGGGGGGVRDEQAPGAAAKTGSGHELTLSKKERKKKKKRELKELKELKELEDALRKAEKSVLAPTSVKTVDETKGDNNSTEIPKTTELPKKDKKRKRMSEASTVESALLSPPAKKLETPGFLIGADLVKNVQRSMAGLNPEILPGASSTTDKNEKKDRKEKKKQRKSKDKSELTAAGVAQVGIPIEDALELKTRAEKTSNSQSTPQKRQKRDELSAAGNRFTEVTPIAAPSVPSVPKKTPVPLPPPATPVRQTFAHQSWKDRGEVVIPETPPSSPEGNRGLTLRTPIPPPQFAVSHRPEVSASHNGPRMSVENTATSEMQSATPTSAQKPREEPASAIRPKGPRTPTPKKKKRKRTSRASSISSSAPSTTASSCTKSIIDLLNRTGKPYTRSGASTDPFTVPSPPNPHIETHQEAGIQDFNAAFKTVRHCVNFTIEAAYLTQYLDRIAETQSSEYPLPCLGPGSGCTTKRHEALEHARQGHDDTNNNLSSSHSETATAFLQKAITTSRNNIDILQSAIQRFEQAQTLLRLSIHARIPVPLGRLSGKWTLYCPSYSLHHVDRYGYGDRALYISSISGFKHTETYSARLSIPPRSMPYTILTFMVPPHASFRSTVLKTSAEGYAMEVTFLGNGFLVLRMDLNLLLKGKPTEVVGGRKAWMEFLGVNERAVEWEGREEGEE